MAIYFSRVSLYFKLFFCIMYYNCVKIKMKSKFQIVYYYLQYLRSNNIIKIIKLIKLN